MLWQEFWILSGWKIILNVIFKCVTCSRHKELSSTSRIDILSDTRVQSLRTSSSVSTNYGEPYMVKKYKRQNTKTVKININLFFCITTMYLHIEVVSDYKT
jgi:hypothetical protein